MGRTSIEWTATVRPDGKVEPGFSINPIRARDKRTGAVGHYCEKVSHGCTNCYSSALQKRFNMPSFLGDRRLPTQPIGKNGYVTASKNIEVFLDESKLHEVLRRRKPTKYFWCDMTDMFGSWVPDEWIDRCFAVMALTPQHTHQVLTKRPERMLTYLRILEEEKDMQRWGNVAVELAQSPCAAHIEDCDWPLPNVWLGISCENQEQADKRIPILIDTPAAVRFLSCEPLLEGIDLSLWLATGKINWVIVGGESG